MDKDKKVEVPFTFEDIQDVRIIIKAKDKHWAITPKLYCDKETSTQIKILSLTVVLEGHDIVDVPLEDLKDHITQDKLLEIKRVQELNASGYAGIMPNGNIVDRREHPEAHSVAKNSIFGIAEPKEVSHA